MVLGHDSCGAIDATINSLKDNTQPPGHIPSLVAAIAPAVKAVSSQGGDIQECYPAECDRQRRQIEISRTDPGRGSRGQKAESSWRDLPIERR